MSRYSFLLCAATLIVGCAEPNTSAVTDQADPASDSQAIMTAVSFEAGDTATMEVPEMSCAIMCYPKVKEALEKVDGVAEVELVPQEEEGIINDHRVTVHFDGSVSGTDAVAALDKAGFPQSGFQTQQ